MTRASMDYRSAYNPFAAVPGGTYRVGLPRDTAEAAAIRINGDPALKELHLRASTPVRVVSTEGFHMAKKPVTAGEFRLFFEETGYVTESEREGWGWTWSGGWLKKKGLSWRRPFGDALDTRYSEHESSFPALQVSWNDAVRYCRWREEVSGKSIRLPQEHEWEIFAFLSGYRGINEPLAAVDRISDLDGFIEGLSRICGHGESLCMGAVWEWTGDWYDAYPGGPENPDFGTTYRVLRGGSLMSHELQRTREFRFRRCPTARSPFYGFRILSEIHDSAEQE